MELLGDLPADVARLVFHGNKPASAHALGIDLSLEQACLFAKGIGMLDLPQRGEQQ